jgi:hypothetical protein
MSSSPRPPAGSSVSPRWVLFPRLSTRSPAAAAYHKPDTVTRRAPSHPAARLERAHAQLTARGGILAPPGAAAVVAAADRLLAEPLRRPASLVEGGGGGHAAAEA